MELNRILSSICTLINNLPHYFPLTKCTDLNIIPSNRSLPTGAPTICIVAIDIHIHIGLLLQVHNKEHNCTPIMDLFSLQPHIHCFFGRLEIWQVDVLVAVLDYYVLDKLGIALIK